MEAILVECLLQCDKKLSFPYPLDPTNVERMADSDWLIFLRTMSAKKYLVREDRCLLNQIYL